MHTKLRSINVTESMPLGPYVTHKRLSARSKNEIKAYLLDRGGFVTAHLADYKRAREISNAINKF